MVKACKIRPIESRQKKWDTLVWKEFSHQIDGCSYHKGLQKYVCHDSLQIIVSYGGQHKDGPAEWRTGLHGMLSSQDCINIICESGWKGACSSLHQSVPVLSRVVQHQQNQQAHCSPGKQGSRKERRVEGKLAGRLLSSFLSTAVVWTHWTLFFSCHSQKEALSTSYLSS